ncbi:hypothetical protein MPER_09509 [Moniliophthora perniciosa FA553]|nr:hypothetical protein MPER_09509 [Moniliophthora perniciosa FA553]
MPSLYPPCLTNATSLADVFEATTSPAPIRPYSSLQMLGAVAGSSTTEGSASNPFGGGSRPTGGSGFPSLTQLANRQRIEHAHETLPRKKRGKAIKPPSLLGESYKPKVEDCLRMAQSGEVVINLDVFVLPPQPPQAERREFNIPQHLYRYLIHQTSFRAILGGLKLTFSFSNLRISTTVGELLKHIADRLRCHGYVLNERSPPPFGAIHESLPLRLLAYSNLGRVSGNNKTPRLVPANVMAEATIADIVRNPRDFAIPKWAVSDRSTFELHAIIQSPVLEIRASLSSLGLGNDMVEQMHQCISRRLYGAFRNDSDARTAVPTGRESQGQEDAEEEGVVAQSLLVPLFKFDVIKGYSNQAGAYHFGYFTLCDQFFNQFDFKSLYIRLFDQLLFKFQL